ncbi:MAG: HD domain-containing protein [Chloroflexi bacterium]|nr:HD domain-containing protein [Chloroflexota bacterium]
MAGDLGRGLPQGHVFRTTIIAMHVAQEMGLDAPSQADVFYTSLLVHAGCTAGAPQFAAFVASDDLLAQRELCLCDPTNTMDILRWMRRNVAPGASLPKRLQRVFYLMTHEAEFSSEFDGGSSDVGSRIAKRLGMPDAVQESLYHICETWSGKGPHKLRGTAIPLAARVVNGSMVAEVLVTEYGPERAVKAILSRQGKSLDPGVANALCKVAARDVLLESQEEDLWPTVLALEPRPTREAESLDAICEALADFIDLKSPDVTAHSRATAALAEAVARIMGLPAEERVLVRRAALVHDLGLVAVPTQLLSKTRTPMEEERHRTHPYYTHHILSRVPALRDIASVAAMHHERLDGTGYHLGLRATDLPLAGRILAVADAYQEVQAQRSPPGSRDGKSALEVVQLEAGQGLDAHCVAALALALESLKEQRAPRGAYPVGLTEREVDVLRLAAQALTVREMAKQLVVSEATVRHHLEHIYDKLDVSSRAGAVLFAAENGLLG